MDPTLPGGERLEEALRTVAREDAALRPSAHVDADLRARVRARRHGAQQPAEDAPVPAPTSRADWRTWATAAAASLLFVLIWRVVPSQPPERLAAPEPSAPTQATDFLPLPYAHVPVARGHIVRMTVPRQALAAFGLDPGRAGGDAPILADVFVGDDGLARSVRFVVPSTEEGLVP